MKSKSLFSVLSVLAAAGIRTALAHGYVDNATIGGVFYQVCLFFLSVFLYPSFFFSVFLSCHFLSCHYVSLCVSVCSSPCEKKERKKRKEKKKEIWCVCARANLPYSGNIVLPTLSRPLHGRTGASSNLTKNHVQWPCRKRQLHRPSMRGDFLRGGRRLGTSAAACPCASGRCCKSQVDALAGFTHGSRDHVHGEMSGRGLSRVASG